MNDLIIILFVINLVANFVEGDSIAILFTIGFILLAIYNKLDIIRKNISPPKEKVENEPSSND